MLPFPTSFMCIQSLLFAVFLKSPPPFLPSDSLLVHLHFQLLTHVPCLYIPLLFVAFPPPPPCSPQVSSSLHPSCSCLIKPPNKLLNRSKQPTAVSASALTWIGLHTNKWEWLSSDLPMKNRRYMWPWLHHMEEHICKCRLTEILLNTSCSK